MLVFLVKGDENVSVFSFVAKPVVKADIVAYELKSKLIVFDVLVKGDENVSEFSLVFKFVIVAYVVEAVADVK